jgi:hypothetical protein
VWADSGQFRLQQRRGLADDSRLQCCALETAAADIGVPRQTENHSVMSEAAPGRRVRIKQGHGSGYTRVDPITMEPIKPYDTVSLKEGDEGVIVQPRNDLPPAWIMKFGDDYICAFEHYIELVSHPPFVPAWHRRRRAPII